VIDILKERFGQRIKNLREQHGLTQAEVARRSDMSQKYLGDIERGNANLTLEFMVRLGETLTANVWDLLAPDSKIDTRGPEISGPTLLAVREGVQKAYNALNRASTYLDSQKDSSQKDTQKETEPRTRKTRRPATPRGRRKR